MGYRVVKLSELASYEFGNIEGAFAELGERELERVLPQGMALNTFKTQLQEGQLVLLSDAPNTPALSLSSSPSGEKTWQFNTAAQSRFSPQAQTAFVSRTKAQGSSSRSGGSSGAQAVSEPAYTPQPPVEEKPEKPGVNYEYLFEVACSEEVLASEVGCQFALGKTPKEASIVSWETKPSEHGTVFSAKAKDSAPRKLIAKVANTEKGVSNKEPVKLKPKDTGAIREAFIPVVPSVQLGSRLGFPTEGFYYHFHNNKLVQEYKILGEDRWAFYATRSTHERLNTEQGTNKYQGAILLYWKIDSKVVKDQHLIYLDQAITREQLDNLNDDWLAEHGAPIDVPALLAAMQPQQAAEKPYKPQTFNAPANVVYDHKERLLMGSSLKAINSERLVESGLPVVKVRKQEEKTLRIGVFFDGTGNNLENDKYKEVRGNTSRTNVARLFEAYPQKQGKSIAIYVSGVGTVDYDNVPRSVMEQSIDNGDDLTTLAMATGALDLNGETSADYKWQSLISQLKTEIDRLKKTNDYNHINHIEFDVFGFSRGAALARHFMNAALKGMPNYDRPRTGRDGLSIKPNLLSTENSDTFDPLRGYQLDLSRRVSIRFAGLFDTVGSFYKAGNNDEGKFKLAIKPDSAETVYHITAHHEYRKNFPLTSLKRNGVLPPNFFEEVFPGAHADVGGGYPSAEQYGKEGLPDTYGFPITDSYNLELDKQLKQSGLLPRDMIGLKARYEQSWNVEIQQKYRSPTQHGRVKHDGDTLYFYRLQPISTGLQGLSLERMKTQGELAGIQWNTDLYKVPKDFIQNPDLNTLADALNACDKGVVQPTHWSSIITPQANKTIHRPYDIPVSPGYHDIKIQLANSPNINESGELFREIFDNV
ncbi:DUF2235 domain-containing protein [Enterovibrio norvegicus]|uniref:DUF2235 domain-containing protein n=1 Tax=Enterovibrio norvegicus TaxID=188144 RepID=UPI000C8252D8|nr:DUF2235 domain-containing protein [Enterovibrio norvegicus]